MAAPDTSSSVAGTDRGQTRRNLAVAVSIALTLILLAALYLGLRESLDDEGSRVPVTHTFRIDISGDADSLTQAQSGVPIFKVSQGDTVTLVARSTQPGSLHVHVYDRDVRLVPGGEVTLTFEASVAGAFPVHWHDPNNLMIHMAVLEVQPR